MTKQELCRAGSTESQFIWIGFIEKSLLNINGLELEQCAVADLTVPDNRITHTIKFQTTAVLSNTSNYYTHI